MPEDEKIAAFYNEVARDPEFQMAMYRDEHRQDFEGRIKRLLHVILPLTPRVLEVGCADGRWSAWMAHRVKSIVGVDVAEPCIERCRGLGIGNAVFHCGRIEDVLETLEEFDLVLILDVLEHVVDPFAVMGALEAKSNAILASVPINESPNANAFDLDRYHRPRAIGDASGHIWSFRPETFMAMFSEVWHYEDNKVTAIVWGR